MTVDEIQTLATDTPMISLRVRDLLIPMREFRKSYTSGVMMKSMKM
jgi:hypothetical protein